MKWFMFLCVAVFVSSTTFGQEPTPAEPQSVLASDAAPAATTASPDAAAATVDATPVAAGRCRNGVCLLPWRDRTVSVAASGCGEEVVARTVSRPEWFGCGRVERTRCHTRRARCCR